MALKALFFFVRVYSLGILMTFAHPAQSPVACGQQISNGVEKAVQIDKHVLSSSESRGGAVEHMDVMTFQCDIMIRPTYRRYKKEDFTQHKSNTSHIDHIVLSK